jgi:RNA polymerase sigma-70 factor (ECF subfamily)
MDANSPMDPGVFARDRAAMARVQQGERNALAIVICAYQERLFQYIFRRVRHRQYAEDILNDVWQSLVNHAPGYNLDKPVSGWLYRCARNRVVDYFRRKARRREVSQSEFEGQESQAVDLRLDLIEAIKKLKPTHRAVAWLRLIRGFSNGEIAQKLKRPPGTVYRLVFEVRKQLQASM